MMTKESIQEISSLIVVCLLGAIILAVILFIATLSGAQHTATADQLTGTATTTPP